MTEFATFGQELYFDESMQAIQALSEVCEPGHLSSKIAELLPQPSRATRLRLASKIIQRYFKPANPKSSGQAFPRMVRNTGSESARRDLLYWRTARTDRIIAALMGEVFYPYFVWNALPSGYDEAAFRMANTATLFSVDRVISRDFAIRFACDAWGFDSARTVTLALRIAKQAEILDAVMVKLMSRHVLGYYPQAHPIETDVFAYCLYEEFLDSSPTVSLDRIHNGDCVKVFLLNRLQVDSMLKNMEKKWLIAFAAQPGGKHIKFSYTDMDSLVHALSIR